MLPPRAAARPAAAIEQKGITNQTALADFTPSMMTITGGYPQEFAYFALRGQGPAFGATPGVVAAWACLAARAARVSPALEARTWRRLGVFMVRLSPIMGGDTTGGGVSPKRTL